MRIALIGNENNILFSLTRYLRDAGCDADLLLFDSESAHFMPHNDSFEPEIDQSYVRTLTWGNSATFSKTSAARIASDLAPYDFLIGCGAAPAFAEKAGRRLNPFIPYGGDLYRLAFPGPMHLVRRPRSLSVVRKQREAIEACPHILFNTTNPEFEGIIARVKLQGCRHHLSPPMLYHPTYTPEVLAARLPQHPQYAQLRVLREENDLFIFQHGRQYWRRPIDKWALKGNDFLIRGFCQFLKTSGQQRAHLVLVEYGKDVAATKALVRTLGVESRVSWLPQMSRKWLMTAMQLADVVVGELYRSWLTYGVACEALWLGKPLLHKCTDADFTAHYDTLYPMLHAESAADVATRLRQAASHSDEMTHIGHGGQVWLQEYTVRRPVQLILDLINAASR